MTRTSGTRFMRVLYRVCWRTDREVCPRGIRRHAPSTRLINERRLANHPVADRHEKSPDRTLGPVDSPDFLQALPELAVAGLRPHLPRQAAAGGLMIDARPFNALIRQSGKVLGQ